MPEATPSMSERNATASWSGYSHQGQVGLLIALRKLQEAGINKETYFVQFETHEDVAIYERMTDDSKRYHSVHQVKASYADQSSSKCKYQKVLNNPFQDGNEKYLHTAVEIEDWDTSDTQNINNVQRFEYKTGVFHCDTTEIELFIEIELNTILQNNSALASSAHIRLSFELDHRIRKEHQKKHKHLFDIKFSLQEIDNLIRSTEIFDKKEIYDCRKLFYETFIEIVKTENFTDEIRENIESSIIQEINNLDDSNFRKFLQHLNFNNPQSRLSYSQVFFNPTGLEQVFFRILFDAISAKPELFENTVEYKLVGEPSIFVLTAIIDEESKKKTVIKNILENLTSQNILWENHSLINKEISGSLSRENPSFNAIGSETEKSDDNGKFMRFTNTQLVKRDAALNKLNNGTNH